MISSSKDRSTSLFFLFLGAYLIIILNLYVTQINNHHFYQELKHRQYYVTITNMPPRAAIVDRNGNHLAINKESFAAFIMPKQLEQPSTLLAFLEQHFPKSFERYEHYKNHHFMYIQRRITPDQRALIEESGIVDIKFLREPSRYYPMPSLGALLGMTDIDNKGLFGLELAYNELLAGSPTTVTLAREARSQHYYFYKETNIEGKQGTPITLTIDGNLQYLVYQEAQKAMERLQAQEISVLVVDPISGEILTLVNLPDFDPNKQSDIESEKTKNNIISDTYELGSVIKTFAALAALEEGVVTPDEIIDCKNTRTAFIDGRKINTVYPGGLLSFSQVIEQSNNIGIAQVTKRLGNKLYDYYCRLGFGKKTGIPFPSEQQGFVNPPQQWSKQSLISLSYGYEIRCSLLQLAKAFCILARDGQDVSLKLIKNPKQQNDTLPTQLYQSESTKAVKQMLEHAARNRRRRASSLNPFRIMSKTGTANLLSNGSYDPNRNVYTCAGIIEHDSSSYQRVIIVFIREIPKKNMYAATVAGPLFDAIAEKIVIHDKAL